MFFNGKIKYYKFLKKVKLFVLNLGDYLFIYLFILLFKPLLKATRNPNSRDHQ